MCILRSPTPIPSPEGLPSPCVLSGVAPDVLAHTSPHPWVFTPIPAWRRNPQSASCTMQYGRGRQYHAPCAASTVRYTVCRERVASVDTNVATDPIPRLQRRFGSSGPILARSPRAGEYPSLGPPTISRSSQRILSSRQSFCLRLKKPFTDGPLHESFASTTFVPTSRCPHLLKIAFTLHSTFRRASCRTCTPSPRRYRVHRHDGGATHWSASTPCCRSRRSPCARCFASAALDRALASLAPSTAAPVMATHRVRRRRTLPPIPR
ncbi:hypothetical protein C8R45DRAFT_90903 [Mycena sanguinolenta]|nr:hypothetical protein C8R45DRAFT_90903 [Mycena sanguinolenta]